MIEKQKGPIEIPITSKQMTRPEQLAQRRDQIERTRDGQTLKLVTPSKK